MQTSRRSVQSVYFDFNTLSRQNYFFPEGMGGVQNTRGNSGGVGGGVTFVVKKWKFRGGGGGGLREIPSVVGVWIFSGTTQCMYIRDPNLKKSKWRRPDNFDPRKKLFKVELWVTNKPQNYTHEISKTSPLKMPKISQNIKKITVWDIWSDSVSGRLPDDTEELA